MRVHKVIRVRLVRPAVLEGVFYDIGQVIHVSPRGAWVLWRHKVIRFERRPAP